MQACVRHPPMHDILIVSSERNVVCLYLWSVKPCTRSVLNSIKQEFTLVHIINLAIHVQVYFSEYCHNYFISTINYYDIYSWYLSNGDTFAAIQSVLISEVILYIICAFDTNKSVLIRDLSLLRGSTVQCTMIPMTLL